MPHRPQPANWGPPPLSDRDLDELARSLWGVEEIMTALRAGPGQSELTGETLALAEFRRVSRRTRRRRGRAVPAMRLVAAAALIAVAVCGAAAETGRLPTPIQNLAHAVFAAPTPLHPRSAHAHAHSSVDTRASWSRACQDYLAEAAAGRKPWQEAGYRALVSAADGSGHVTSYCANGDFPSGISYPGQLPADQRAGWPSVSPAGGSSPNPAGGAARPGRDHVSGPGSAGPGTAPSTSPGDAGQGTSPGATPAPTAGTGGGASPGGSGGWGPAPSPGPSNHYPDPGS